MPNRHLFSILTIAAAAVAFSACGPADAQYQTALVQAEEPAPAPPFAGAASPPEPQPIEVPPGSLIAMRLDATLSSHETAPGTTFEGLVTQETSIGGRVAIPVGSIVHGRVTDAHPAKKIGGRAILSLAFERLQTASGESVAISAHLAQRGTSEVTKDAAIIGGGTIGGAIIGDAIHEGEGGTIGAIVGGIAGTVGALKTKGKPLVLPAGTLLTIELEQPITLLERP